MPNVIDKIIERAEQGVDDLATLDVTTLTGRITIESDMVDDEGKIDLKKLYTAIGERAGSEGDGRLEVVAFTHLDFDCDSVYFVREDLSEGDRKLLEHHEHAVKTARDTREAFVRMIKELLGG
jgi:hypothetical protein